MANDPAANALHRIRLLAAAGGFTDASDGELLNRCAAGPDEAAFTALVERHGAMVYGVCLRILGNPHDAEDACQATFVVLARKAASIRKRPSAACWLHGVARRASLTLLRERVARQRRERAASAREPQSTSAADLLWSEGLAMLDEELERLPERLRGPIVLCYLQGKTRDEAAAALGITQGRLHGLLQRGRTRLHDRLVTRGVSLGAGLLAAGLGGGVGHALPPALAIRIAHGAFAAPSGPTSSIANEVLRAMFYSKLKIASAWSAACVAAIALVGAGLFARDGDEKKTESPAVAGPTAQPEPKPDPKPGPKPMEVRKVLSMATDQPNDFRHATIVVSNEHKSVLSRNLIVTDRDDPKASSSGLHLWTLGGDKPKRTNLGDSTTIGFIPKSALCYAVGWGEGVNVYDTRTHAKVGEPFPHELREDTMPLPAVSPEGGILATRSKLNQVQFWNVKTGKPVAPAAALRGIVWSMEFSPDGKWLFTLDDAGELNVWDPATGMRAAGPFKHDSIRDSGSYSPKSGRFATVENGRERDAEWKCELVVRSSKDWSVVQRMKLAGFVREVQRIDESRFLIVGEDKPKLDAQGLSTSSGRNLLHVATLTDEKSGIQTVLRGDAWIASAAAAPDGKHFIAITFDAVSCWKVGEPKPIWTKPGARRPSVKVGPDGSVVVVGPVKPGRAQFGDGDWVLLTNSNEATLYSLATGKELWRQEKIEDAHLQGSDVWVFGQKAVEVWRFGQ